MTEYLHTYPHNRPTVLFSDWTIAYYENNAGRLLGQERGRMRLTAASSAWKMTEEGRFSIREGAGRDMVALFLSLSLSLFFSFSVPLSQNTRTFTRAHA